MSKYITLTEPLYQYLDAKRSDADDPLLRQLRRETEKLGDICRMQVGGDQGMLLSILVAATGAQTAVEIGTFTGYSALCIARALPPAPEGKLHCFDVSDEYTKVARRYWKKAGLDNRITLHLGPARDTLVQHCPARVDFAFVDADKTGYDGYYEFLLPRLRPGGLILFDNMLQHGRVIDDKAQDESVRAIRALNDKLRDDRRVEAVLSPIADGVMICRKR